MTFPNDLFDDNVAMARVLARREEKLPSWSDEKMWQEHHDILLKKIHDRLSGLQIAANSEEDGPIGSDDWQFIIKEHLSKLSELLALMASPITTKV